MSNIPSNADKDTLRLLAEQIASVSELPVQREKANLWQKMNDRQMVRPMVWINEIPWDEFGDDSELRLQTTDSWSRQQEMKLRRILYQWNHFPADMIVSGTLECYAVVNSTGYGLEQQGELLSQGNTGVFSQHFVPQILNPEDVLKIRSPEVFYDRDATEQEYQHMCLVYKDILPVQKVGIKGVWFTPWDNLIRWWGVQEAMLDMVMRPEMVREGVRRFVDACLCELEQWQHLNLLTLNIDNTRVGSGGYGFTENLPGNNYDPDMIQTYNMWGCSNAQVFSGISPEMHWEFALKYELKWLEKWGLTYYGCCEPLNHKIEILRKIKNLRKISISPWADINHAVRQIQNDYVLSVKVNPAPLAESDWTLDQMQKDVKHILEQTYGCSFEIILKDISTTRNDPRRIAEWEKMVMESVYKSY
jgi:hypothetical protein